MVGAEIVDQTDHQSNSHGRALVLPRPARVRFRLRVRCFCLSGIRCET